MLVTDGDQRAALAVVRSLGNAGYKVHVCSARSASIAGASRYCSGSYRVADPLSDPGTFLSDLEQLAATTRADVLLPVSEASLLIVLPNRDRFTCSIPFPAAGAFEQICDKRKVIASAKAHDIAVPSQTEISKATDASRRNGDLHFPLVLKPHRSVAGNEGRRVRTGVAYATDEQTLAAELRRIPADAYPVLLQQRIDGPGFGISVLVWNERLLAAFAHQRIREKPPSGGVSVLRESIPLDHELLSRSLALLRDFSWQGVAMVEYKLDAASGVPYLMEINGRLWGSLQLAIDAGVDFPKLLMESALGENPAAVTTYKSGVRLRWEWGEVDHLLASLFRTSPLTAVSPTGLGSKRLVALADFFRSFSPMNNGEILRLDDPAPFIRETVDWFLRR